MSLAITIYTTANRQRRFFQTEAARCEAILSSLKNATQWFAQPSLIIVSDENTEIFSPRSITRIELETDVDLVPWLPSGWELNIRAIPDAALTVPGHADAQEIAGRLDCFFNGGDVLAAWLETLQPEHHAQRTARIAHLFDTPVIPYRPINPGIGLINPATMTRVRLGAAADHPPARAWFASET